MDRREFALACAAAPLSLTSTSALPALNEGEVRVRLRAVELTGSVENMIQIVNRPRDLRCLLVVRASAAASISVDDMERIRTSPGVWPETIHICPDSSFLA